MPSEALSVARHTKILRREDLLELAGFCDEQGQALSFYFSLASTPDNSHREELTAINRLIQKTKSERETALSKGLAEDLEDLANVIEEIRVNPARLRAVFACREKQVWRGFDLPAPGSTCRLEIGRQFHLFPLISATQQTAAYIVVLVETGKARAFVVRGTEIQEVPGRLPVKDLSLRTEDSRVGWSCRIDKNVAEHEKAYFRDLAGSMIEFMAEQQNPNLLIGCRDDLWGEVGRHFAVFEDRVLSGRFHLPNFAIGPPEVLRIAGPMYEKERLQRLRDLLTQINETPLRAAFGMPDILRDLEEGRVQKLILSRLPQQTISECHDCKRMWSEAGQNCIYCGSRAARYLPAEEGLIRQALNSHAEIFVVEPDTLQGFSGAAALKRY